MPGPNEPRSDTWQGWLIDTPNPLEIEGAINDCKDLATDQGLG
jgi:hypothetical protein